MSTKCLSIAGDTICMSENPKCAPRKGNLTAKLCNLMS